MKDNTMEKYNKKDIYMKKGSTYCKIITQEYLIYKSYYLALQILAN